MRPRCPSRPLCFVLAFSLFSRIPASVCYLQEYIDCLTSLPFQCGEVRLNVSYPFTAADRSGYCGIGEHYNLSCKDDAVPVIQIGRRPYRVIRIDYEAGVLSVADLELEREACPLPRDNATLDRSLFDYTGDDLNITLHYNCTPILYPIPSVHEVPCLALPAGRQSYVTLEGDPDPWLIDMPAGSCSSAIVFPLRRAAAESLNVTGPATLGKAVSEGFDVRWTAGNSSWCRRCLSSGGSCGYNSSNAVQPEICFCPDKAFSSSCPSSKDFKRSIKRKIVLGIVAGTSGLLLLCITLCCCYYKKPSSLKSLNCARKSENSENVETFLEQYGTSVPKRYRYVEVKRMTKSFTEKLGQGGYGTVFKGKLPDGQLTGVKVLKSEESAEEFINEVASIGRTHHVNVVGLLGFCCEGSKRALLYEYMPNGSLEKFIFLRKSPDHGSHLGWEKLLEIAVGIARGLEYLHRGCKTRIVHFDIKPHNILLDEDFCPKISDFGLAQSCRPKQSILSTTGMRGTIGYIAPEVFSRNFGAVSSKSDVYSYGMMVLEMVGGRRNAEARTDSASDVYFPHWIYDHFDDNAVLRLHDVTNETEEVARKMILVGLWCIQTSPSNRPSMSEVLDMLEGKFEDLQMPPKPYLSTP